MQIKLSVYLGKKTVTGYNIINLADVIKLKKNGTQEAETAYDKIMSAISAFECNLNDDVEHFLRHKAVIFAEQGIAATFLVFTSYKNEPVLVGYFTLANKTLVIPKKKIDSKTLQKRIAKFGEYNPDLRNYQLSIPLIAQLGKNFSQGYNSLITGDELLKLACDKIAEIQLMLSGNMTYVECEEKKSLINFYTSNGFIRIANRKLDSVEKKEGEPAYLVQLIKYIKK